MLGIEFEKEIVRGGGGLGKTGKLALASFSTACTAMAYARFTSDNNIWQIDLPDLPTTGRAKDQSPTKLIYSAMSDISPQYSPDGKKIVFESDRSGNHEIWLCDSAG